MSVSIFDVWLDGGGVIGGESAGAADTTGVTAPQHASARKFSTVRPVTPNVHNNSDGVPLLPQL